MLNYLPLLKTAVEKVSLQKNIAKGLYESFALENTVTYPYFKHAALIMILYNLQRKDSGQKWPYQCSSSNCGGLPLEDFLLASGPKERGSGLREFCSRTTT